MGVAETIAEKLTATFAPSALEVEDESHRHEGHSGWREGGESHFRVRMTAPVFAEMSRVQRSRAVHKALEDELAGPVHALALELNAP